MLGGGLSCYKNQDKGLALLINQNDRINHQETSGSEHSFKPLKKASYKTIASSSFKFKSLETLFGISSSLLKVKVAGAALSEQT